MSRASKVRDAIRDAVTPIVGAAAVVESVTLPLYNREQVVENVRVALWVAGREVAAEQGVDPRDVVIGLAVVGPTVPPDAFALDGEAKRKSEVETCDVYDDLAERLIEQWTPDDTTATLRNKGMADHAFWQLSQPTFIDAALFRENGVYSQTILLTYRDSRD